ncbi:hypothetical protein PIROE2DRAFT_14047 [Piromyces sp. E2]|nr:hypothetical protein PIROE2DRAFT_14047 [Piromyces sp. E2]|eukprot:OUM60231.1 hypothetical protein PIROE2DRAFT_14047 [Piromyces sp. E2]
MKFYFLFHIFLVVLCTSAAITIQKDKRQENRLKEKITKVQTSTECKYINSLFKEKEDFNCCEDYDITCENGHITKFSTIKLLFDRFSMTPNIIRNADVVSIGHRNLSLVPYTGSDVRNSLNDNINDSWESLVFTTLSNFDVVASFFYFI